MNVECMGFEVLQLDSGVDAVVYYFLETFQAEVGKYGIYVEKEVDDMLVEAERTGGFLDSKEEAEEMVYLMLRNQVTPCVLNEVIYDYLYERICG